jgi:hypothetical protein
MIIEQLIRTMEELDMGNASHDRSKIRKERIGRLRMEGIEYMLLNSAKRRRIQSYCNAIGYESNCRCKTVVGFIPKVNRIIKSW